MTLANRIQELRETSNLSQEQLANQLNVSRQAISKWENGLANPDLENIIKLSETFNVSNDYLLTGKDKKQDNGDNFSNNITKNNTYSIISIIVAIGITLLVLITSAFYLYRKYF